MGRAMELNVNDEITYKRQNYSFLSDKLPEHYIKRYKLQK